ncbi:MAG: UDP-N-acetylglucosamine 2-epimerase (non-hydrolyzing) [Gammaproteobacteria bacterium]|nr:UDP-N-acetylglucosamine 2-epimerase (non-hydrolyzing) [Gammaproteobacteria bacterium]
MKIITIIGARPQFIKASVVSRAFALHKPSIQEMIIHTGQHYDSNMSDIFFNELDIKKPDYNLGIGGGSHGQNTGRMIEKIETVLLHEQPDCVLVYGDTDSTLAGTLAAVKLHIPIAHIEAGLRSFNRQMPEEINRILTDHAANLLFTPTNIATKNLSNEGIKGDQVQQLGDVMYDVALYYAHKAEKNSRILKTEKLDSKNYILATVHRAENTDNITQMKNILSSFAAINKIIVWPIHPRTRKRINDYGLAIPHTIKLIDPVGYLDMVMLEKHASLIITDSGGVQKEAFFHKVACITLREETEWLELIELGANILHSTIGFEKEVLSNFNKIFKDNHNIYGSGNAADKIVDYLYYELKKSNKG